MYFKEIFNFFLGTSQFDLYLASNNYYFLFTNKEIGDEIKEVLDFHATLVVHGYFPEKKDLYYEYKFSNFISGQRNRVDAIPTQEIFFGSIN